MVIQHDKTYHSTRFVHSELCSKRYRNGWHCRNLPLHEQSTSSSGLRSWHRSRPCLRRGICACNARNMAPPQGYLQWLQDSLLPVLQILLTLVPLPLDFREHAIPTFQSAKVESSGSHVCLSANMNLNLGQTYRYTGDQWSCARSVRIMLGLSQRFGEHW